jgi:hypothetical protein
MFFQQTDQFIMESQFPMVLRLVLNVDAMSQV